MAVSSVARSLSCKSVLVGYIAGSYGVQGWLKVASYTRPVDNILTYKSWSLSDGKDDFVVNVDQCKLHGKSLLVHISGCDDRTVAQRYRGCSISVFLNELPALGVDEVYWHQLEGLKVVVVSKEPDLQEVNLGKVNYLMDTGANDVLVVGATPESVDKKERLVPWLMDIVIVKVDFKDQTIWVDWDPEF